MEEILGIKINELGLSYDTTKWLKSRGVKTFRDILCMKLGDVKKAGNLPEMNRKELISFVHKIGFRFIKDEKDTTLSQDELCVGDLELPLGITKIFINEGIIRVNNLKNMTREQLLALPKINEQNINEIMMQIGKADSIVEEILPEQLAYEKLIKEKKIVVRKLNKALNVVQKLEKENTEIDRLLIEAKEQLNKVKVKK